MTAGDGGRAAVRLLRVFAATGAVLVAGSLAVPLARLLHGVPLETAMGWIWFAHPGFDLWCYTERFSALHTPAFFTRGEFPWNYPAGCALVYAFLYWFNLRGEDVLLSFPVYSVLATGGAVLLLTMLARGLRRRGARFGQTVPLLVPALVFSWPLFFAQERGNLEAVLWLLFALGVLLLYGGRPMAAAVCFGLLGSAKLYPLVFLGLLVPQRRWRAILLGLAAAAGATVAGLWLESPDLGLSWAATRVGMGRFVTMYTLRYDPGAIGYDHSLFALWKAAVPGRPEMYQAILPRYMLVAGVVAAVLFLWRVIRLPAVNQLTVLAIFSVLLPPTSFDYTLCVLLVPMGMLLLLTARRGGAMRAGVPAMVLYAVLLAPETFLTHAGVLVAGQVKAVALVLLLAVALLVRWGDPDEVRGSEGRLWA